jgi:YggT family protein
MISVLIIAVNAFADVLIYMLLGRAILSWFVRDAGSPLFGIYQLLIRLTEPMMAPCRRLLARFNTGMFDFSILIAFLFISLGRNVIIALLYTLM